MPGMNRTGPEGRGPMTGRGLGYCGNPQGVNPGYGRGMGRGMRNGRGNGPGMGRTAGPGRGLGWFSAGYSDAGYSGADYSAPGAAPIETIKDALGDRVAFLRAELARTEAMLGSARDEGRQGLKDSIEDEGK